MRSDINACLNNTPGGCRSRVIVAARASLWCGCCARFGSEAPPFVSAKPALVSLPATTVGPVGAACRAAVKLVVRAEAHLVWCHLACRLSRLAAVLLRPPAWLRSRSCCGGRRSPLVLVRRISTSTGLAGEVRMRRALPAEVQGQ